jgi:hypothetical protein
MKLKLSFDDVDFSEVVDGIRDRFQAGVGALMSEADGYAKREASRRLKRGLSKWLNGFKINKVSNDFYIISIDGKLANWMEDGIQPGEISRAIMSGNRADVNRGEGKNYVDVPIAKDADAMGEITLGKSGPKVQVSAFKDADSMLKSITTSDWKKGGTKKKQVIASRVQDIIKNVEPPTGKVSYLTIRRVTDDSMWPKSPFQGAKVLDDLGLYLENNFDKILERYL